MEPNAYVWRERDKLSAHELAMEMDAKFDHVIIAESFAKREQTWLVIAWH